jgi:hypothetical protein
MLRCPRFVGVFVLAFVCIAFLAPSVSADTVKKTYSAEDVRLHLEKFMEELPPEAKAYLAASAAACPPGGQANVIFTTPPNNNVNFIVEQCSLQCQTIAGNTANGDELCLKIFNVPQNATFNGNPIPGDGSDVACAADGNFSGTFCFRPDHTQSGIFSILFVLTDKVTTCSQTRIVTYIVNCETVQPEVTCPSPQTASLNADCQAVVPDFTLGAVATDNCTPNNLLVVTQNPPAGSLVGVGVHPIVITAMDACGNTGSCQTTLTVADNTPPTIVCPADVNVSNDPGQCSAVVSFVVDTTDNCPGITLVCSPASGSAFPVGTSPVTCTATDAAGNTATCSFNVTVNDTEAPVAICPADVNVSNDPGQCSAVVDYIASATDNCPGATILCSPASGSAFPVGTSPVTCTATDAAGNTATCSFNVTVNDTEAPVAICPPNITVHTDSGRCDGEEVSFSATGSDNCSGITTTCNPPTGSFFPVGVTSVSCLTSDGSGNEASCQFNVDVFVLRGDMDGNGLLTPPDPVLLLFCAFLGTGTCDLCFADLNCDGLLTPVDPVLEILVVFMGLQITCQP